MGIASDLAQFLIFVLDRLLAVLREGDLYGASRGLFVWIAEKLTLGWLPDWVFTGLAFVLMAFLVLIVVLTVAPGFTWIMRKVMAHIQSRMGPMYVGPHGLMQPMADGLKLVMKEDIIPARADPFAFRVAPYLALVPVMAAFAVIPFGKGLILADVSTGILFLIAISSAGPLGEILAGWASNNKFAMIGGLRAAALDVSYEIPMILTALAVVLMAGNLSMSAIVEAQQPWWFALMLPLGVAVFLASALARIGVVPLDLPEAESELVAGYFTEYSGMRFGTFFLGVFAGIFLIAALTVTLFFGGWTPLPVFPTQTVFAGFVVVGGTLFLATYLLSRPDARAVGFFAAALSLAGWGLVSWYLVQGLHGGFATLLWQYWIFGAPDWMAIVLTLTGLGLVAASGLYFLRATREGPYALLLTGFMALALLMALPLGSFLVKSLFFSFVVFWIWFTLPRIRPDQFLRIGWKVFFPIALVNLVVAAVWRYVLVDRVDWTLGAAATILTFVLVLAVVGRPRAPASPPQAVLAGAAPSPRPPPASPSPSLSAQEGSL